MNIKHTDITTIIVLNKNKQHTKSLQIKTKHLNRLWHYGFGILAVVVCLIGGILYLKHQNENKEAEKKLLMAQLIKLKGAVAAPKADKGVSAQTYIQSIQLKLQQINEYLRKRGLKGFSTKGVGSSGAADGAKLSDKDVYLNYDEYLGRLVSAVGYTPMGYPRISSFTSFFGYRSDPFNTGSAEFHPGIDFKGQKGDEVKCTANGSVVFAGWYGGYGNCVRVAHGNNLETLYGHLSRIIVKVGQQVAVGEKVGEVGSTGHSTGTHLHYEVRKNGRPVNPVNFLTLNK
ncbi:M23 family metallopeptidase [Mucilaginibacter paludis]|uniref:Peptidase M23 n=1 Tax=Mucilaginibacter paludis DSM 18603 TaxID=714943 RepID=H1YHB9_9SPHI|nr:M23 family metallopeptidase [Mucilaginibacter paludis]EHQ25453.1 Peptidase M23 [Mucilaginibacter paludis DSM 18603]